MHSSRSRDNMALQVGQSSRHMSNHSRRSDSSERRSSTNNLRPCEGPDDAQSEIAFVPIGTHRGQKPLTWVAECRIPRESPSPDRLAMAKWMIENGSDVHQDGDAPLARAALQDHRIPMMELLVSHGADVNARGTKHSPVIYFSMRYALAGRSEMASRSRGKSEPRQ